jgi:signal transduction histidine kinase
MGEERARAEALLNRIRAGVVVLLGFAAIVYSPRITPALARLNIAVLVPVFIWTLWQQWRYHHADGYRPWLAWANPVVDIAAITLLQAGYGILGAPGLAVHTPVFLAYFAVLASRPLTGSARHAAITTAVTAGSYGVLSATFLLTGRLHALASPLEFVSTDGTSLLNEATKVLLLLTVGAISTYATAWNERTLRRALAAQVRKGADERELAIRLQEADKLSALGTIAAAAVHDVRNPLTTIGLQAELLLLTTLDQAQRTDVANILADARRAATFVDDLLRVTRASTAPDAPGPVSLMAVVIAVDHRHCPDQASSQSPGSGPSILLHSHGIAKSNVRGFCKILP